MSSSNQPESDFEPAYHTNAQVFAEERAKRLASLRHVPTLPESLPSNINSGMTWHGISLNPDTYILRFSKDELDDINQACAEYNRCGNALKEINKESFHLPPNIVNRLVDRRLYLHHGSGLLLLRDLQPEQRTQRENFILFAGLASHLSEHRGRQSGKKYLGPIIHGQVHVTDLTNGGDPSQYPAPYCRQDLPFHTDTGDLVAMFVFAPAAFGGDGIFASVSTIYNELAKSSPDLLDVLALPDWPFDRPPDKSGTFYKRPVMFMNNGQPEMIFSRGALIQSPRGQRPLEIPKLTRIQTEALDAVQVVASKVAHRIQYQSGDMLLFNNRKILHGRDSFVDAREGYKPRHIIRLWLRDEELAGKPPSSLQRLWDNVFAGEEKGECEDKLWPQAPDLS